MPVARIFSESASDAAPLAAHLRDLGYTIELASPNSDTTLNADLEIRLERCNRADALAQAERRARELGADVYIADGALAMSTGFEPAAPQPVERASVAAPIPQHQVEPHDPLSPGIAGASERHEPEIANMIFSGTGIHEVPGAAESPKVIETGTVALSPEPKPLPISASIPASEMGLEPTVVNPGAPAAGAPIGWEVPAEAHDDASTMDRLSVERLEQNPSEALPIPRAEASSQAWARSTAALSNAAATVRNFFRQASTAAIRGLTLVGLQLSKQIHAMRQSYLRSRARKPVLVKSSHPESASGQNNPAPIATESLASTTEIAPPAVHPASHSAPGITTPQAPAKSTRPLPWMAFAGSGAVAAAVLLTWSVLAGHPAAPVVPVNGNVEQQIPFGPVKIHPQQPRQSTAHSAASSAQPVSVRPLPSTPSPSAKTAQAAPSARNSGSVHHGSRAQRAARRGSVDDEVIVRHYGKPVTATKTQISSTGVKHISDQE